MQQRELPIAIEDADLRGGQADLAVVLLDAAATGELQIEVEAAAIGRRDVGGGTAHHVLRKADAVDGAVAEPDVLDAGRKAGGRRRLRRQVHESLADRLAVFSELLLWLDIVSI